jgi:hypothetical protein
MDAVSLSERTKLIRAFPICTVNNSVRSSPSARCANFANVIRQFTDVVNINTVILETNFPLNNPS